MRKPRGASVLANRKERRIMIHLNGLDWILLTVTLFCAMRGLWRGAISQVFGIAGVMGGFILASHFFEGVAVALHRQFPNIAQPLMISYLLIFFLAWFCIGAAGYWLSGLLRRSPLGFIDRIMGLGVGLVKALVMAAILISLLTFFLPPQSTVLTQSVLTPYVLQGSRILIAITPITVRESFHKKKDDLMRQWSDVKRDV